MRFRWKILCVLLVASLTPIGVMLFMSQGGAKNMSRQLSEGIREGLTELMVEGLEEDVAQHTTTLDKEIKSLEFMAETFAREASNAFAADAPASPTPLLTAVDFDSPTRAPADLQMANWFKDPQGSGPPQPLKVSFSTPAFHSPHAGLDDPRQQALAHRCTPLLPLMRSIMQDYEKPLFQIFIALNNGLFMAYPGHGGIPEGWDHREEPFYQNAVAANATFWSAPVTNPATGQLSFTVTVPITDAQNRTIGMAGMDLLVTEALGDQANTLDTAPPSERPINRAIHRTTDTYYAFLAEHPDTGEAALRTIGRGRNGEAINAWLVPEQNPAYVPLVDAILQGRTGHLFIPHKGEPSIWAFSPIATYSALLFIMPREAIEDLPNEAANATLDFIHQQRLYIALLGLAVIGISTIMAIVFAKRMTKPVMSMVEAAERLSDGDFSVAIPERTGDERDTLIQAFNAVGPRLQEHMRMRQALEVAEEVQQNLLPREMPLAPGYDIAGRILYCDETGGDYLDAFTVPRGGESSVAMVVGDVTGHGVPSALLMATARALLRGFASLEDMPGGLAGRVTLMNRLLCQDVQGSGRFMTLFFLELDYTQHLVRWVRAGHDPALLYSPQQDDFSELRGDGLLLGVADDFEFVQFEEPLQTPGSIIILGTDGIWEAANEAGEQFGKERLKESVRHHAAQSASEIVQAVLDELHAFVPKPQDDVTLVIIKKQA